MANELRYKTARDLFVACPAVAADMSALPTEQASIEFCRTLLAGPVPEEAITFCAYLLAERAAVWWAHECLSHLRDLLDGQDLELLMLVGDWISEPDNPRHHAALGSAVALPPTTPVAWIALAVIWRDDGLAANEAAMRPFPAAHAVNAGILTGLARVALADRFSVLSAFVEMGIQTAEIEALRQSAHA